MDSSFRWNDDLSGDPLEAQRADRCRVYVSADVRREFPQLALSASPSTLGAVVSHPEEGSMRPYPLAFALLLTGATSGVVAAPQTFVIDPDHTFPSFEADHMGVSVWRGKFNRSQGRVVLDREAGSGTLEVDVDVASIDFGLDTMNEHARAAEMFDVARFPQARYRAALEGFKDGEPTRAVGELTLRGVTRPLTLDISHFHCTPHPLHQRELCGADVHGTLQRDTFGIVAGKDYGFDMTVTLRIQVEANVETKATK